MKVAVFGVTGSVGSMVAETVLKRGHVAVGVSRATPSKRYQAPYESRVGDVTDPAFLRSVMQDCDGLIFCIGQRRKSEKNLFSARVSPADIRTQITKSLLQVIGTDQEKRFVYLSAFGVGADLKQHALLFRMVLRLSSLGESYEDHKQAEGLVRASSTNWTIVRPVGLTDKDEEVALVDARGKWSSSQTVSKKSLARFLVDTVENRTMERQTLTVVEDKKA